MSQVNLIGRLKRETEEMVKTPPDNCSAGPKGNDITVWEGTILGPKGTPFEGGLFPLSIKFPSTYPFTAPHITFTIPVYHPNISNSGAICLDILKDQWSPALTIAKVLLSLCSLLTDPNPNDPLEPNIAKVYRDNKLLYEQNARKWTKIHAMGDSTNKKSTKKTVDSEEFN